MESTILSAIEAMDVQPDRLSMERDAENGCWLLVGKGSDYAGPDRDQEATIAAFFHEGPEPPPLLVWLVSQVRREKAA